MIIFIYLDRMKITKEDLELLNTISWFLDKSYEQPWPVTLEYVTPAEWMRRGADALENKDMAIENFRNLLRKLKGEPTQSNFTISNDWSVTASWEWDALLLTQK